MWQEENLAIFINDLEKKSFMEFPSAAWENKFAAFVHFITVSLHSYDIFHFFKESILNMVLWAPFIKPGFLTTRDIRSREQCSSTFSPRTGLLIVKMSSLFWVYQWFWLTISLPSKSCASWIRSHAKILIRTHSWLSFFPLGLNFTEAETVLLPTIYLRLSAKALNCWCF